MKERERERETETDRQTERERERDRERERERNRETEKASKRRYQELDTKEKKYRVDFSYQAHISFSNCEYLSLLGSA